MKDAFYNCHPAVNLLFFAVVIGFTMFSSHPLILAISFVSASCYSIILKGFRQSFKTNFLFVLPLMLMAALINPLFNHYGVTVLGYLSNGNPITLESLLYGLNMALMLAAVIGWFSCYTHVMSSDKSVYLFGKLIPALSLVLSMALKFVPVFVKQAGVIGNGQKCMGRGISNGSVIKRAKHGVTIFSILLTWSMENAIDTADSMKCRGYGEKGRSAFSIFRIDKRDSCLIAGMLLCIFVLIYGIINGSFAASFDPEISINGLPFTIESAASFAAYFLFCMIPVILSVWDFYIWEKRALFMMPKSKCKEIDYGRYRNNNGS